MATPILLPKLGNTVETCIIETWHKQVGDSVKVGDVLCDVETDKATLEVEAAAEGTILALHYDEGDEVPVLAMLATVGQVGEQVSVVPPTPVANPDTVANPGTVANPDAQDGPDHLGKPAQGSVAPSEDLPLTDRRSVSAISPRARKLAATHNLATAGLSGTGPNGRIIERDVLARLQEAGSGQSAERQKSITPVAKRMVESGEFQAPPQGSGPQGRIMRRDLDSSGDHNVEAETIETVVIVPVKGARRVIAQRMLHSVQTTAPFTLHRYANATALRDYRQRLKESNPQLGLAQITLNELLLFATVRTLGQHPEMNAHFLGTEIHQFGHVALGFAVDTPRGLMVPVIQDAQSLTLNALSHEVKRLVEACQSGSIKPDELAGGTFTVSNLGALAVETFTPVLNPPQVGILGMGNIALRPVERVTSTAAEESVTYLPHIALSLTVNHQAVDGAPAARFLETFATNLAHIDLLATI